ncbi:MAG TPA: DEAD/DEAH box helicase [Candidatus Cybelea sp.]|nr:DEAD/DEAH box helicase [Candidatus Cybelea sp.]
MTVSTFAALGLSEPLQRALSAENYLNPTPIQTQAIPALLAGRDLLGIAQTGTGKTAAFALPLMQRLAETADRSGPRGARALVLAPTRELAVQIGQSFRTYGQNLGLRHATVYGGVGIRPQIQALTRGVDILVATPGRLLDLMAQGHARLDRVSFLVLDEADRMLDMGFVRDVRKIVAALPKRRQTALFSATMPADIQRLVGEIMHDPARVEIVPSGKPLDIVEQRVFMVDAARKRSLLTQLLGDPGFARVIVFTRTKRGADRVAAHLENAGIGTDSIHGNKSQNARQRALDLFRQGRTRVLVATDIAARGIDVDDITHVINYELPNDPESYVHRIGRTARAGATGVAISLCEPAERGALRDIERLTRRPIAVTVAEHRPDAPSNHAPAHRPQAPNPATPHAARKNSGGRRKFRPMRHRRAA